MNKTIFVLNGPNLNLLGVRQPHIYGYDTLDDVKKGCAEIAREFGLDVRLEQSNWEGQIIDWIHDARTTACGIIINPGAFTHTSVAIRDALATCEMPLFEVHISNVHAREAFRHHSYVSDIATGVIAGFGVEGYMLATRRLSGLVTKA